MTDPLLSALVARNRWLLARPAARATGLAPPAGLRSSRAGLARPVARATGLAPSWSRCVRLSHDSVSWWLVRGSRAALVSAAHSFSDRSVPRAREFHWNSAALDSSTLVAVTVLTVPRVQSKEDQVRLVAPTQMALCLRPCLLPTLKGESCYAPSEPSMTRLHNEELVK